MINRFQAAIKAWQTPTIVEKQPQKSYTYDLYSLMNSAGTRDNQLTATAWGATLAYYKVPAIKSSVDFIAENAAIVPMVEMDANGNEIARSDKNPDKSRLITAILDAYDYHGVPLIQEWVSSRLLYGQTFIQLVLNDYKFVGGLRWLNPNAISINVVRGEIQSFHYGADTDDVPNVLPAKQVLYGRAFNPGSDIYGYSSTLNVMGKTNITLDFDRFTIAYYKNGGQLGMAVSFKEPTSFEEAQKLAEFWRRTFRGVDNFFKTQISHIPLDYQQFDPVDISKPLEVSQAAERSIYKGYRVAPELLGDTENNPYQFSDETKNAAMQTVVKPALDAISNALNNKAAKFFLPDGHTFAFDLSQWETVSADVISTDVQAGIIDLSESASKRGYKPDPRLKDIYLIDGKPMHVSIIQKVAMEVPPEYLPQPAFAPPAPSQNAPAPAGNNQPSETPGEPEQKHVKAVSEEAFAYIPLANNADVLRIQRELKKRFDDERIEWQAAPTLHVTLCYGELTDEAIDSFKGLSISEMQVKPALDKPLRYFDTPDGKAVHIALDVSGGVRDTQEVVYQQFWKEGRVIGDDHFESEQWNPHITLAYFPNDIDFVVDETAPFPSFVIQSNTVIIGRDDYDPVLILKAPTHIKQKHVHIDGHTLDIETWDYTPDKARKELAVWQKHAKADRNRPFVPIYTRGQIADVITDGLQSDNDDITAIFDAGFDLLPQGIEPLKSAFMACFEAIQAGDSEAATKSLQSIRIDFELDFEAVLADIRNGNIDNRRRAGNILRQLIRTFGFRAYVQGLQDGGVMDDPSEEDEAEITRLRNEQSAYVSNLTRTLIREDGVTDTQAQAKPEMWWRGSIQPFYNAGLASANANGMYEWVLGATEEHCDDCPRLNGQRHRLKDWRRRNLEAGTVGQATECEGYQCKCRLVPTAGKARGRF